MEHTASIASVKMVGRQQLSEIAPVEMAFGGKQLENIKQKEKQSWKIW